MRPLPARLGAVLFRGLAALACFAGLASVAGCSRRETVTVAPVRSTVKTIVAQEERVGAEVASFGTVTFLRKAEVVSTIEGDVAELAAEEGSVVGEKQLLARLSNLQLEVRRRQAEAAIASARAGLELAHARLWEGELGVEARIAEVERAEIELSQKRLELSEAERTLKNKEELFRAGGITEEAIAGLRLSHAALASSYGALEKELEIRRIGLRDSDIASRGIALPRDEATRRSALVRISTLSLRAEVEVARARLAAAEAELSSVERLEEALEVRSPMAAIVGARYIEAGEHVASNARLFTMIDSSTVCALFPLAEADAVRAREGMSVEVTVDALGGRSLAGRVDRVSPLIDPQAGTVSVRASILHPPPGLKPGMFARVRLALGASSPAVLIPASCIVRKEGSKARLFAVVNGRAFAREVTLGREIGGRYVVEQGLRVGERLIDSPPPVLQEGEAVDLEG